MFDEHAQNSRFDPLVASNWYATSKRMLSNNNKVCGRGERERGRERERNREEERLIIYEGGDISSELLLQWKRGECVVASLS